MRLAESHIDELARLAAKAAKAAGTIIAQQRPSRIEKKSGLRGASQWVTDVDHLAEETILSILKPSLKEFELGLLTEEQVDDRSRFDCEFFWCVDPLDGTLPYVEGVSGYAVSIALVSRQGHAVLGAVYDPVTKNLYCARAGGDLTRNSEILRPLVQSSVLSVFVDRSFLARRDYIESAARLQRIAIDLGLAKVTIHSGAGAVMNACQVLRNPRACYLKLPKSEEGGGSVWDFAATACFFEAAGAVATDIHGGKLDLNRGDSTFMNHRGVLYASDAELAGCLREFCK